MTTTQTPDMDRFSYIQNDLIRRILKQVNNAVVFADTQFMEWFHLTTGIDRLLSFGGALNVREFNRFEVSISENFRFFLIFLLFILLITKRAIKSV